MLSGLGPCLQPVVMCHVTAVGLLAVFVSVCKKQQTKSCDGLGGNLGVASDLV